MSGPVSRFGVVLAAAVLLVGCGGSESAHPPQPPRLPQPVARTLAATSDALAVSLERGDACSAARQAAALRQSARQAVAAGRVPRPFRAELLRTVAALSASAPACTPPPVQEDEGAGKHDRGKHKGWYKHGRKD